MHAVRQAIDQIELETANRNYNDAMRKIISAVSEGYGINIQKNFEMHIC